MVLKAKDKMYSSSISSNLRVTQKFISTTLLQKKLHQPYRPSASYGKRSNERSTAGAGFDIAEFDSVARQLPSHQLRRIV